MYLNHFQAHRVDSKIRKARLFIGWISGSKACLMGSTYSSSFENDTFADKCTWCFSCKDSLPFFENKFLKFGQSPAVGNLGQDLEICSSNWLSLNSPYYATPFISTFKTVSSSYTLGNSGKIKLDMAFLSSILRFNFLGFAKSFDTNPSTLHFLIFCYFSSPISSHLCGFMH